MLVQKVIWLHVKFTNQIHIWFWYYSLPRYRLVTKRYFFNYLPFVCSYCYIHLYIFKSPLKSTVYLSLNYVCIQNPWETLQSRIAQIKFMQSVLLTYNLTVGSHDFLLCNLFEMLTWNISRSRFSYFKFRRNYTMNISTAKKSTTKSHTFFYLLLD